MTYFLWLQSGFGRFGSYSPNPAYDMVVQVCFDRHFRIPRTFGTHFPPHFDLILHSFASLSSIIGLTSLNFLDFLGTFSVKNKWLGRASLG